MLVELNKGETPNLDNGKTALLFHIPGHCAGCKRVIKILETKSLTDWTIYKVDSECGDFTDLISQYQVQTAPTIITFENGEQKDVIAGLKDFIEKKEIFGD